MAARLIHTALLVCCVLAALSALFLSAVLVYATEPTTFTWRVIADEAASDGMVLSEVADPMSLGEPACEPIILARAPIAVQSIADFATEAVIAVNTYDYLNWDQALPKALNTFFTPVSARTYFGQFSRSGLLRTVTDSYYTVSALSSRPAMVVASAQTEGVRSWTVQVPITVRYQTGVTNADGGNTVQEQQEVFVVTVLEQRPSSVNFRGVAINDISNEGISNVDDLDRLGGAR